MTQRLSVLCITEHSDRPEAETFIGLKNEGIDVAVLCSGKARHYGRLVEAGLRVGADRLVVAVGRAPAGVEAERRGAELRSVVRPRVARAETAGAQAGFLEDGFLHVFVIPASGGSPRQLTAGDWHVGARAYGIPEEVGLEWMPDGRHLVFVKGAPERVLAMLGAFSLVVALPVTDEVGFALAALFFAFPLGLHRKLVPQTA